MSRMRQIRKLFIAVLIGGGLVAILFARTGYLLVRPGSAEDLSKFVTVQNGDVDDNGTFYLVTVTQQHASPVLMLYAVLAPNVDLQQRRQVIPPGMDPEEYQQLMQRWMEESQNLARVIALRRQGFEVPIESDGVEVVEVGDDSPAKGILQAGDIIRGVDGEPVFLAEELIRMVQLRPIGNPVTLRIIRDSQDETVIVDTTSHTEQPDKAAIRVLIHTLNWQPRLPKEIEIETGEITGPSAGLMFVLEILNQLDPTDIAGGRKIAGTGTINLQEEVGSIGGVRQKVAAAEKAGAEFFFVPLDNFADAQPAARRITLVPVGTLDEALQFLQNL
ncbi:MAG: PDZ domain-containing protein [Clostridiales bacterium]|nr:PDZ domain-containing protein [Clostridiales bacterium]